MGSGSRGCLRLREEGQGAIHQGPGPQLYYSDLPSEGPDLAPLSAGMGSPKPGGIYWGREHLHVEIPAPTKQMTLRPRGEEFMHHVIWFAESSNTTTHHSPWHCLLHARLWGKHFRCMNGSPNHLLQMRKSRLQEGKESHSQLVEEPAWGQRFYCLKLHQLRQSQEKATWREVSPPN